MWLLRELIVQHRCGEVLGTSLVVESKWRCGLSVVSVLKYPGGQSVPFVYAVMEWALICWYMFLQPETSALSSRRLH